MIQSNLFISYKWLEVAKPLKRSLNQPKTGHTEELPGWGMFNFLQDLVVVANCLPYIACLWTPLPPTVNESSAIKDIKQKLPSSQYVRPSFQKIISYPSLAFRQETSMNLSVFHEQGDLGYHIC